MRNQWKGRADMKWVNYTGKIYYEFKLQGPSLAQVSSKVLPDYDKFRSCYLKRPLTPNYIRFMFHQIQKFGSDWDISSSNVRTTLRQLKIMVRRLIQKSRGSLNDKMAEVIFFLNQKFGSNLIWVEKKNLRKNTMNMGLWTKEILVFVSYFKWENFSAKKCPLKHPDN